MAEKIKYKIVDWSSLSEEDKKNVEVILNSSGIKKTLAELEARWSDKIKVFLAGNEPRGAIEYAITNDFEGKKILVVNRIASLGRSGFLDRNPKTQTTIGSALMKSAIIEAKKAGAKELMGSFSAQGRALLRHMASQGYLKETNLTHSFTDKLGSVKSNPVQSNQKKKSTREPRK